MALKIDLRKASGINGLAGPLLMSTIKLVCPMSMRLKFRPDRASSRMRRKSGSNACCAAISFQLMPNVVMAFTTQLRSSSAACRRAAASPEVDERVEDATEALRVDEGVGDADASSGVDEDVEE